MKDSFVAVLSDGYVLGPFETVKEAMQQVRVFYKTEDAFEAADENMDFYLSRLFPTVAAAPSPIQSYDPREESDKDHV